MYKRSPNAMHSRNSAGQGNADPRVARGLIIDKHRIVEAFFADIKCTVRRFISIQHSRIESFTAIGRELPGGEGSLVLYLVLQFGGIAIGIFYLYANVMEAAIPQVDHAIGRRPGSYGEACCGLAGSAVYGRRRITRQTG